MCDREWKIAFSLGDNFVCCFQNDKTSYTLDIGAQKLPVSLLLSKDDLLKRHPLAHRFANPRLQFGCKRIEKTTTDN